MSSLYSTAAISTAIATLLAGGFFTGSSIAQTTTPISPTAPYGVQFDPGGNVQIYPGNVTQPSAGTSGLGVQNSGSSTSTGTGVTATPVSPTAPAGVQSSPNGNVQVFPGNNVQTGGSSTGTSGSTSVINSPSLSPTAPAGVQSSPNGNVQVFPGNNVQTNGSSAGTSGSTSVINNPSLSPTAPAGVQSSPNGNVQVFPGNNVQTGGGQTTTPNAPGIIQIIPTNPSGTPQSTALPGTSIGVQSPTGGTSNPSPQNSQPSQTVPRGGTLDAQLLQATCNQNWGQAVQIVNRAIAAAPATSSDYRAQLSSYRDRLQALQSRSIRVPNWQQQCTQGFTATQLAGQ